MPPKQFIDPNEDMDDDGDMNMDMQGMFLQKFLNPNHSKEFMASLPDKIRERAEVLLMYHDEYVELSKQLEKDEMAIHREYDAIFAPLMQRRYEILHGLGAPLTDEEVRHGVPEDHVGAVDFSAVDAPADGDAGIPGFWLQVLKHHVVLDSLIEAHDEPVLHHLRDVTTRYLDGGDGNFEVSFKFAPNDYLTTETITVAVRSNGEDEDATIERAPYPWREGKDVSVKTTTKTQRAKRTGKTRTVTVREQHSSFFHLLYNPASRPGAQESDVDLTKGIEDEQVCQLLFMMLKKMVPCAINYYTGEAPDGESEVESEYDEEDDDEDDE